MVNSFICCNTLIIPYHKGIFVSIFQKFYDITHIHYTLITFIYREV